MTSARNRAVVEDEHTWGTSRHKSQDGVRERREASALAKSRNQASIICIAVRRDQLVRNAVNNSEATRASDGDGPPPGPPVAPASSRKGDTGLSLRTHPARTLLLMCVLLCSTEETESSTGRSAE